MEVKISAVILTLNEEKNIERCITSVLGIVDDVVVVDSFSTDRTEEICLGMGVRFIKHKFEGYGPQKNWALDQAAYPIVLSLDADEALSDELRASILEVKQSWDADGYSFNRLTSYCGKWIHHCGWYPDAKLRLWDIRKGGWQNAVVHESIDMHEDTMVKHLQGDLLHYTTESIHQHVQVLTNYGYLSAKQAFAEGKRSSWWKILVSPRMKFFKLYILKKGFLDGYYGYVIAKTTAFSTYLKYIHLRDMQRRQMR